MESYRAVPVWGGVIRSTHWINALSVLTLLVIGGPIWARKSLGISEASEEMLIDIHASAGLLFACSLMTRIACMLAGREGPSHWRDLIPLEKKRRAELMDTLHFYMHGLHGKGPVYFAHNALAGLAYAGFFLLASFQVLTGAAMYLLGPGISEAQAHAGEAHATAVNHWPPAWLHEPHEIGALLILLFVLAHMAMLVVHELVETRGLASSMISGQKFFTDEEITRLESSTKENNHE